jgi:Domain of unknown function (DUF4351)
MRLPSEFAYQVRDAMRQIEQEELGMDTFQVLKIGRKEGRNEERHALMVRLLERKIGTLNPVVAAHVTSLSPETLLRLRAALLDCQSATDLVSWLDRKHD